MYFILEYAPKGDLYKYIELAGGFGEKYGKLLIYKILLGVQGCHEVGVYHMDLKLQNILLDDKYNPKICDFGFGIDKSGFLSKCRGGTENYMPPQLFNRDLFTGEKVDIYYLGHLFFIIVVGSPCYQILRSSDKKYKKIKEKDKQGYFKILETQFDIVKTLDDSFKDLLFAMLAYEEEDRPKNISEILENKWFDEVRNNKEKLEKGLNELFLEKEQKIIDQIQINPDILKDDDDHSFLDYRGIGLEIKEIFPKELRPRKKNIELGMDCFIRFKGNFNYYKYMNKLLDRIQKEFANENGIIDNEKSKMNYEFDLIFELNEEENENDEKESNFVLEEKEDCIINLELYQSENEDYILRFLRKSDSLEKFYSKKID